MGLELVKILDRFRFTDQLQIGGPVDGHCQTLSVDRVVIHNDDRNHTGPHKLTCVPQPGAESMLARPPTSAMRSMIDWLVPNPAPIAGSNPPPSSLIVTCIPAPSFFTRDIGPTSAGVLSYVDQRLVAGITYGA